eukprot:TRINITY_DN8684_c0_g1_i1.p1 TRINITY_DN8684_c0_g1~~TRINITY_DN8684_c0_g1_i1.p1  ORF type:complete len:255 (-),score=65.07 TRINITY_DN8684_c0_g1_i1:589-1332(-)
MSDADKTPELAPLTILKNKRSLRQITADRATARIARQQKKKKLGNRQRVYKRAESLTRDMRKKDRNVVKAKRAAVSKKNHKEIDEDKVALVIRIRGINGVDSKTRKILQLLRLRQVHTAVFVKLSKPMVQMLNLVNPYITWGYPSRKTVKDLIFKRGYGKINGERVAFTNNTIIEEALGKQDIICLEDVVHEICTVGENFKIVNKFIWPFKLSSPKESFKNRRKDFKDGGECGNRGANINALVQSMN